MSLSDVIQIPPPAPRGFPDLDPKALEHDLAEDAHGEVRSDRGSRRTSATDASNYPPPPLAAVAPRSGAGPRRRHQPWWAVHQRRRGHRLVEILQSTDLGRPGGAGLRGGARDRPG